MRRRGDGLLVDHERLTQLRRCIDLESGVVEEFLTQRIGPSESLALLSSPLRDPRGLGWVICPSLGPEHGNLRRLEALLARSLAAVGFPVLRVRPDVHPTRGAHGEIDLSARLMEVGEAAALLREECGIDTVALLGVLFGATLALLSAERLDAAALVLVEPVLRGKRYVRETVRRQAIAELMVRADDDEPSASTHHTSSNPLGELASLGQTWVRGLLLTREEYDRIAEIDLLEQEFRVRGSSLLIGVSSSGALSSGAARLRDSLLELGADIHVERLDDPLPAPLGEYYYRNAGAVRVDTRLDLDLRISSTTTTWAVDTLVGYPRRVAA